MTKTIASATNPQAHYLLTIDGDHATHCTCKGFQYRSRCHHITDFNAEIVKAQAFLALKARIAEAERQARRNAYLYWELSMGL